jgi:hypothetical protein
VFEDGEDKTFTLDGKLLKHAKFISLSHTKPEISITIMTNIKLPKQGDLVYVRMFKNDEWLMRYFSHYNNGMYCCYNDQRKSGPTTAWGFFSTTNPLL